ncbi:hypothetical protein Poly41_63940 [Novipirellula artificiosorum]|uniref:Major facilitator superfamily (MFS) profile domain-containing protein n=1 Tax=Novipirellula artificiosorum TaxID=2528016 RepID=A0A5C6D1Z2_9BACT|nr:hypothetical protein Poly41_63940 [Novipirellula artificiosorum]
MGFRRFRLDVVTRLGVLVFSLSLSFLGTKTSVVFVVLGMGFMQGMFSILSAVTWPRFFGRSHLGAVSGMSTSIVVVGTAISRRSR